MESLFAREQKEITHDILIQYLNIIKDEFNIDIRNQSRVRPAPDLLKIFCYHAHYNLKFSKTSIGVFVNRHHSAVIAACKAYHALRTSNPWLDVEINDTDKKMRVKERRGSDFVKLSNFLLDRFFTIDGYERPEPNKDDLILLVNCASEHTRGLWLKMIQDNELKKVNVNAELVEHE
jgi:hypothetical protein